MRRTLVISLLLVGATAALTVQAAPQKPNVIMLFIDDLGMGDIGAFGCKDIPTPQIDRLAKEVTGCLPTRPMSDDGGAPF